MPRFPGVDVDDVARSLAAPGSRRGVLRALGAGLLASFAASSHDPDAVVAARQRSRKRRKKQTKCQKLSAVCNRRKVCCKGSRCVRGRCQCPPAKKRCGANCVPKAECCPPTGHGCVDSATPNCSTGFKSCGQLCIPEGGCCRGSDCPGECESGICYVDNTCQIRWGKQCGQDSSGRCNSVGVCAGTCSFHSDCPLPLLEEPRSAEEFCRERRCDNGVCEIGTKLVGTIVHYDFQPQKPCEVFICNPGFQQRYSLSEDLTRLNDTVPLHENECMYWTCKAPSELNEIPDLRPVGTPCGPAKSRQCDGNGTCVDGL